MSAAEILDDLDPGMRFNPSDDEIVQIYLLPRARGQLDPFPGLVIEDDAAANTQPWKLFSRHGLADAVQAFFYVRTNGAARPDRRCDGGGTWKSQRSKKDGACNELVVDGERIKWSSHNLNFHMGSGSMGWVMHEYSITALPSLKICRISFTGFGQKRKRAPDDVAGEPEPQRRRISAAPSDSWTAPAFHQETGHVSGAMEQQEQPQEETEGVVAAGVDLGALTFDQVYPGAGLDSEQQAPSDDFISQMVKEMTYAGAPCLELQNPEPMMEQHVADVVMPLPMVQESSTAAPSDSRTTPAFNQETEHVAGGMEQQDQPQEETEGVAAACGDLGEPTFDQAYSGAGHSQMVEEMTYTDAPCLELQDPAPMMEQQVADVVMPLSMVQESGTAEQMYAYPRSCGVSESDIGDMAAGILGGVAWGGYIFC